MTSTATGDARPRSSGKSFLGLAGPLVVSFVLRDLLTLIDHPFAARLADEPGREGVGAASLAALQLTQPYVFLMIACWVGASNGLTARLAAALGAGEGARVEQLKAASRRIQGGLIVAFVALGLALGALAPRLVDDPLVAEQFRIYATILVVGRALTSFLSILPDSIVKAHHDTRSTMWAGLISGASNAALNSLFVLGFGWGIAGIALATGLAGLAGLAYATHRARALERDRVELREDSAPGTWERPVRAILALSIPSALTLALMSLESLLVNHFLSATPDPRAVLASWSAFDRGLRFSMMPMIAAGVAVLPLAARRLGTSDWSGLQRELGKAFAFSLAYVALVLVPGALFGAEWIVSDLLRLSDPATHDPSVAALRLLPLAALGAGPMFLLRSAFEGLGRPLPALIASVVRTIALVVPLVMLGIHLAGGAGIPVVLGAVGGYSAGVTLVSLGTAAWLFVTLRALSTR